jgi:hypothetical protein
MQWFAIGATFLLGSCGYCRPIALGIVNDGLNMIVRGGLWQSEKTSVIWNAAMFWGRSSTR